MCYQHFGPKLHGFACHIQVSLVGTVGMLVAVGVVVAKLLVLLWAQQHSSDVPAAAAGGAVEQLAPVAGMDAMDSGSAPSHHAIGAAGLQAAFVGVMDVSIARLETSPEFPWAGKVGMNSTRAALPIMVHKIAPPVSGLQHVSGFQHVRAQVLFCFSGQPNWWRYITSMADRSQFVRSAVVSVGFMTAFYTLVAGVG